MDHEKIKKVVEMVRIVFECPICSTFARKVFILCTKGHLICGYCAASVVRCPLCQGKLNTSKPIVVKKPVEILPRKCKHHENGCEETVTPESQSRHEKFCQFRPVYCHLVYKQIYPSYTPDCGPRLRENTDGRIMSCRSMVPLCKLAGHYETAHPKDTFFKSDHNVVTLNGQFDFSWQKELLVLPFFTADNVFWLLCSNKWPDDLKITSVVSPIGEPKNYPFVRIGFQKGDFVDTRTMEPKLERGECSLEEPEKNRKSVLVVPPCRFKDDDGSLSFSVDIFFGERDFAESDKMRQSVFELVKKFKKNFFSK